MQLSGHNAVGTIENEALAGIELAVRPRKERQGCAQPMHGQLLHLLLIEIRELLLPSLGRRRLRTGQAHVYGDAVLGPFLGCDLGKTTDGLLVAGIGQLTCKAEHAGGGGEVDDPALSI